ncbi:unnamed protein product [Didymodactylos carnosus]|uniref:Uncharacterized protein n=1 Tax=Didymodactylos carnosus TaxID=1234261 RepID=A0A814VCJ6_9BILA|nr:unnamed protein product [Didymodactylos carnosus]CAF1183559.1 unnamed protein product [Didymodactylos carnosus]CAF3810342.1 unnamed protein product [Didymodactylos carnosus]CAF3947901.1 unnamed protein product [Didymodactylos carnosus]
MSLSEKFSLPVGLCCFLLLATFCSYIIYYGKITKYSKVSFVKLVNSSLTSARLSTHCSTRGDKWIVITTIFYPTPAIRKFLSLSSDWKLMIIGDRKTPKDWLLNITNMNHSKIIFLSIHDQLKLDYRIIRYIPEGSYARKNIGYLAAIECGAQVIFESDDDNLLQTNDIKVLAKQSSPLEVPWFAFHRQRSPFVNIYGIFGQQKVWPRGFPIDELKNVTEDGWYSLRMRRSDEQVNAYIQQYLVDLDPDVDALYRLTHPMSVGHIYFDHEQPPVALEPFTFSPYNTQNTVTYYEAFWGLYLPITTTFRVCDIWRGFWVQRMLWDIGGHLVFGTSTVEQKRNPHNLIKDMNDEQQIYQQGGKFVRFLISWNSTADTLVKRIIQLSSDIARAGFWSSKEVEIMNAWLEDIQRIGYKPPPLEKKSLNRVKNQTRVAMCVSGVSECVNDSWKVTESEIRKRLNGQIDLFLFLSSSTTVDQPETVSLDIRLKEARLYNATVKILYEDRSLDPGFPSHCKVDYHLPGFKIPRYFQQLWALSKCYELIREYEQKMLVEYQLLVRSRVDLQFKKVPSTFERPPPYDMNHTILVPANRFFLGYDDGWAIGPIDLMKYYMLRWYSFPLCLETNYHAETYLKAYLARYTNVSVDPETVNDAVTHGGSNCH